MAGLGGRTVRDLRRESRSAVLQRLCVDGPMSRQALGPATGLSSGSVSTVVAGLLADGLVEEAGTVGAYAGRPSRLVRIRPGGGHLIGVDVGETLVRVELFDLALTRLAGARRPLGRRGYDVDAVVGHIVGGIGTVLRTAGLSPGELLGIGIGVPGIVEDGGPGHGRTTASEGGPEDVVVRERPITSDGEPQGVVVRGRPITSDGEPQGVVVRGRPITSDGEPDDMAVRGRPMGRDAYDGPEGAIVHGQTIGWDAVPLERLLRLTGRLPPHVPCFVDNGAKALGQAEMWFGGGRGARNAVVALLGSGVGACVVTEEAAQGRSVEWGHLTVRVAGRRCRCGARGCLEAYAGAQALVARWREAGGRPSRGAGEERALTELLAAARPGDGRAPDPVAAAVLAETAAYLGAGLSDLINLFQPERVLISGWAGLRLGAGFLDQVRDHALARALRHPGGRVRVELGRLGPEAVTVGAAVLPLAAFLTSGGHRPQPAPPPPPPPAWRAALEGRLA
ncbi:ROK family protein [Streptomyces sp. NPDC013455]|uniref:ROK family transcriptional regulator n=1 Tax=Streptomyces sp. NPDC013455 TaxID=3155605 RepID=UPI0034108704